MGSSFDVYSQTAPYDKSDWCQLNGGSIAVCSIHFKKQHQITFKLCLKLGDHKDLSI